VLNLGDDQRNKERQRADSDLEASATGVTCHKALPYAGTA